MSALAESKVQGIIKALSALEEDLDSLTTKAADMQKQLVKTAQNEIDALMERTKEQATQEAESIINSAREKANGESSRIMQEGDTRLSEIQQKIDANFEDAVQYVVSTVLKA